MVWGWVCTSPQQQSVPPLLARTFAFVSSSSQSESPLPSQKPALLAEGPPSRKSSLAVGEAPLQVGRRLREGLQCGHTRLLKASRYVRNASPSKQRHRATFHRALPSVRALQPGGLFSHLIKHHAGISITVRRY